MAIDETNNLYYIEDGDTGSTVAAELKSNGEKLYAQQIASATVTRSSEQAVVTLTKRGGDTVQFGLPLAQTGDTSSEKLAGLMSPAQVETLERGFRAWDFLQYLRSTLDTGPSTINPVTYDEDAGTYTCNGVTNITEENMWRMITGGIRWDRVHTTCEIYTHLGYHTDLWRPTYYQLKDCTVSLSGFNAISSLRKLYVPVYTETSGTIRALKLSALTLANGNSPLLTYIGTFDVSSMTSAISLQYFPGLTDLYMRGLAVSLQLRNASALNYKSLYYILSNAGTPTSAKTITLNATVYAYVMGTDTDVPTETDADGNTVTSAMWQALSTLATEHNFSLASA